MREVETVLRGRVNGASMAILFALLEETRDPVWISRTQRCDRYTLRGVPGNECDIIVSERWASLADGEALVIDKALKVGRFDGAIRVRYCIRIMPHKQASALPLLAVGVVADDGTVSVSVGGDTETFRRLPSDLHDRDPRAIIMWHHARYYRHLEYDMASCVADEWVADEWADLLDSGATLAEANRSASRALYRASRDAGWRKYTLRERERLGLPEGAGQWQLAELPEAPE